MSYCEFQKIQIKIVYRFIHGTPNNRFIFHRIEHRHRLIRSLSQSFSALHLAREKTTDADDAHYCDKRKKVYVARVFFKAKFHMVSFVCVFMHSNKYAYGPMR